MQGFYNEAGTPIKGLTVHTEDGHNCQLRELFRYVRKDGIVLEFPVSMWSDGASTPQPMWNVLPPFGRYWLAAFGHDGLYRGTAIIIINGVRSDLMASKPFCDESFMEMMEFLQVVPSEHDPLYEGVHLLGWHAFNEDRKGET